MIVSHLKLQTSLGYPCKHIFERVSLRVSLLKLVWCHPTYPKYTRYLTPISPDPHGLLWPVYVGQRPGIYLWLSKCNHTMVLLSQRCRFQQACRRSGVPSKSKSRNKFSMFACLLSQHSPSHSSPYARTPHVSLYKRVWAGIANHANFQLPLPHAGLLCISDCILR